MRVLAALLCAVALARADAIDDLLLQARHAQHVQRDLDRAVALYRTILDKEFTGPRRAEVHLRLALCYERTEQLAEALRHLAPELYEGERASEKTRALAEAALRRVQRRLPEFSKEPRVDAQERNRELSADHVRRAQRALEEDDELRAFWHTQNALKLDPENAEARALDAELETRLSGVADFVRDPLRFVGTWTEARVTQIARLAEAHFHKGVEAADARAFNRAEASFRDAIRVIDECELRDESDRLMTLRGRVRSHWRALRKRELGADRAEPDIPEAPRRRSLRGEFLSDMQRMLDLVSAPEREYRLVPVRAPRTATPADWVRKPPQLRLFRSLPSSWSAARFAAAYLPRRVAPSSWQVRGNYLVAAGGMLVARNAPEVLDLLQDEVDRIAAPREKHVDARFLLVPVARRRLEAIQRKFGAFTASHRGRGVLHYAILRPEFSLSYACSFLRDLEAEVRPARDTFEVQLANGRPQTLFAGMPLARHPSYADFRGDDGAPTSNHYGALLDVVPLRSAGRTALGLRMVARVAATPMRAGDAIAAPRFLEEEGELFVDLPPGATLLVAGLADPFAPPDAAEDTTLLLLWRHGGDRASVDADAAEGTAPTDAEVSLRKLLVDVRDDPGPRRDSERGFVSPDTLDVVAARAAFLQRMLREELGATTLEVAVKDAVVRVPPALRENTAAKVAELEREAEESYVIRVDTRAVRTTTLDRWMARESLAVARLGDALVTRTDAPHGGALLRNLEGERADDVFSPQRPWPKATALGLQARHFLSQRSHTSPTYRSVADVAGAPTRTVAEGLRITVRPFRRGGRMRAEVEIETAVVEAEEEERALTLALPSYRTRVGGVRVAGAIDLGPQARPGTVLVRGIPHPKRSRPDRLTEIVVAISVRHVP